MRGVRDAEISGSQLFQQLNASSRLLLSGSAANSPHGSIQCLSSSDLSAKISGGEDDEGDSIFDEHNARAEFPSCSINLLKTILGAGMLSMPAAFAATGYVIGTLLILGAATFSAFGLYLLVLSSQDVGRGVSISRMLKMTYPRMSAVFDFGIALKCFGVAISFLIVIGDMMPSILEGMGYENVWLLSRRFWITLFMLLLAPLAFLRQMDSLKYTSFAGLLSVLYLALLAIWNFLKPGAVRPAPENSMAAFVPLTLATFKSFSLLVFSFTCHQNIFLIQREAKDSSLRFMSRVIVLCISVSLAVYYVFSMISYANFGRAVQGNIFLNYPSKNVEMVVGRCLYAFLSAFSYPLQTLPCRSSLQNLLPLSGTTRIKYRSEIYTALTTLILLGTFVVAILQDDLVLVSGFIGTFVSIPICYLLPFLLYYKLSEGDGWSRMRIAATSLACFGLCAMIFSAISLIAPIIYPNLT